MSLEHLCLLFENRHNRAVIRFKILYKKLKRSVLTSKPRSQKELQKRVHAYLLLNPKIKKVMDDIGITEDYIVSNLVSYAK